MEGKRLQAALFDLDGTCVASDDLHFRAYQTVLLKSLPDLNDGQPITRDFYDKEMSGRQNREIMAELGVKLPLAVQTAIWEEKERIYGAFVDSGLAPIPGLVRLLDECKATGVRFAIVTNAPRVMAERTLAALKLKERFADRVVIAEECKRSKPAPDPYLKGLEMLDVPAIAAVAFEDSPSGTASACAARIFTVGVMSSRTERELTAVGAGLCVKDFTDERLLEMIRGWGKGGAGRG